MVWFFFIIVITIFLALDLGVFNKTPHIISSKEAGMWTSIWVSISIAFSGVIYWLYQNNYLDNPTQLKPLEASIKFKSEIKLDHLCFWCFFIIYSYKNALQKRRRRF